MTREEELSWRAKPHLYFLPERRWWIAVGRRVLVKAETPKQAYDAWIDAAWKELNGPRDQFGGSLCLS